MSLGVKIDLTGDKKLLRKLHSLSIKVQQVVIKKAIRAAAKPVTRKMRLSC